MKILGVFHSTRENPRIMESQPNDEVNKTIEAVKQSGEKLVGLESEGDPTQVTFSPIHAYWLQL